MDEDLVTMHRLARSGLGRHNTLIGQWVVIDGVRTSYRGVLDGVLEVGGGVCIFLMSNVRALESLADTNNEVMIGKFEIYSHAVLGVGKMNKDWARGN